MKSILSLVRSNIMNLTPYESARSLTMNGKIFLDANESPNEFGVGFGTEFGDSVAINRYPEPQPSALIDRLCRLYGVGASSILIGRGSDEAIDLIVRAFCEPGKDEILICPPTYGMYEISAKIQGAKTIKVPMVKNSTGFVLDETGIRQAILEQQNLKVIFLCAPNNPTGTAIGSEVLTRICQMALGKCMVVIDEAYIEFSLYPSMTRLIQSFPHLIVLRTLSKAWAAAGVRCGSALGQKETIEVLNKIRSPYPLPSPCIAAILKATNESQQVAMQAHVQQMREEREWLKRQLIGLSTVEEIFPSDANFLLVRFKKSSAVFESLKAKGIIVRDRSKEAGLTNCIRMTLGSPLENRTLFEALKECTHANFETELTNQECFA